MAGRNRLPPRHMINDQMSGFHDAPPPQLHRGRGPVPFSLLEEDVAIRREEIRRLVANNRLLIEENVTLGRDIAAGREELHNLSQIIPRIRADKETQARDLIQKGLKLEAELRAIEPIKTEVLQLQSELQKLEAFKQEMQGKIQGLSQDLKLVQAENEQIPSLKVDIDGLRQELMRTRAAYEYEKKLNTEQMEQRQILEKNLISMAREVEKLRTESMTMDAMARGPVGPYGPVKGSPDMRYPGAFTGGFGDDKGGPYGTGPWSSFNHSYPRR
ncbi:protein FLX-like 3 [Dioscorea cayenensis subsp. rotundata]|uniref:Protein FLX-like 3 n=1 Tax=Dioscorea cayennensis subsp. rotundata TaxID=55577 RepID=A0AB40D4C8_DIOCR|nr:protein FLX-like 3 [Dioscorea cayenensis subsp. rotundata]